MVAIAIIVAALLVVLSQFGGGGGYGEGEGELYAGIPQNGTTLGEGDAPVTLYLYEDFQCPFCGQFDREMFPDLVDDYVRHGKVKVVSRRPWRFSVPTRSRLPGRRSPRGSRTVTDPTTRCSSRIRAGRTAATSRTTFCGTSLSKPPGSTCRSGKTSAGNFFTKELEAVQAKAQASGVNSTPTLIFEGPGGQVKIDRLTDYDQITSAIDKVDGS